MSDDRKPGPAVVNGVMQYSSVSAMNRFLDCPRSWWWRYVKGVPDPVGKAAEIGIQAHKRIEHYLGTGEDVLSPMERAGFRYMPAPQTGILVEQRVDGVLSCGGVPFIGGIDLVDLISGTITDWKFKGDLIAGRTTPEWLKSLDHPDGRQMLGYAEFYRRSFRASRFVTLRHVHFHSRKPFEAEETKVTVSLDEVAEKWDNLGRFVVDSQMKQAAKAQRPEDVRENLNHCHKYAKPCVYYLQCPVGKGNALSELLGKKKKETEDMSIIARFKELNPTAPPPLPALMEGPRGDMNPEGGRPTGSPPTSTPVSSAETAALRAVEVSGSSPAAATEDESAAPFDPLPAPRTKRAAKAKKDEASTPAPAIQSGVARLYIGCTPVGVETTTLHAYVLGLEKQALEAFKIDVPDIRLAEVEGLKFGKYKAVLSSMAKETPPPPGHYVVTPGDERVDAVAAGLESIAAPGTVVRGLGR